jgi:hypothetical protein
MLGSESGMSAATGILLGTCSAASDPSTIKGASASAVPQIDQKDRLRDQRRISLNRAEQMSKPGL